LSLASFNCQQCGKTAYREAGAINRARSIGAPLYCGMKCAGIARRKPAKTVAEKKAEKAEYDRWYRAINYRKLKKQKAEHFQRTYDPVAAAIVRKARMPWHVEYCRQPAYRVKKAKYDQQRRDAEYGEFAEAQRLTIELNREIKSRSNNYEIRRQNQTGNKAQPTGPQFRRAETRRL
jgi:hypothetical protein